jgi:hypothetical protein
MNDQAKIFLVGDNPFHGISHLSQERARSRSGRATSPEEAAELVLTAVQNGANGFMFSVSDLTLTMLRFIQKRRSDKLELYPIVPYAFEYVRIATQTGTPGLARRLAKQIVMSGDPGAVAIGMKAVITMNPSDLLSTYLTYEISRMRSSAGRGMNLVSLLLHELVTDMALALNLNWLFESYIKFLSRRGVIPGFNTRNFPFLVRKFGEWNIDVSNTLVATPFNKAGFQMNPSKQECERTLADLPSPIVLAISILAAGYLQPSAAMDYLADLPNLKGIVAGVSTRRQAQETFALLKDKFQNSGQFIQRARVTF